MSIIIIFARRNYGESWSGLIRQTPRLGVYGTWKEPWAMRMNYNKIANENEIKGSPIRLLFETGSMRLGWGNIGYGDSDEVGRFLDAMLEYEFGVRLLYAMNGPIKTDAERAKEGEARKKKKSVQEKADCEDRKRRRR